MAKVLVLRTCNADGASYGGFHWPESGPVACPDWSPERQCEHGLHGLLWGEGNGSLLDWSAEARWLVVSVEESDIVDLDGKVKFPSGEVLHCGSQETATSFLLSNGAKGKAICGVRVLAPNKGTATAGYRGTATAGYRGTATAGYRGTATAGDYGTATAGDYGTATADYNGTAMAGYKGTIIIRCWDLEKRRFRFEVGYVGENGILSNVKYRLDKSHKFVAVDLREQ